jgi:hypothetical protein
MLAPFVSLRKGENGKLKTTEIQTQYKNDMWRKWRNGGDVSATSATSAMLRN